MKPINFDGVNAVYGANQPEYQPLPAEKRPGQSVEIVTCWKLTPEEIKRIQETGEIWLAVLTFGQPLQPVIVSVEKPEPYDPQ